MPSQTAPTSGRATPCSRGLGRASARFNCALLWGACPEMAIAARLRVLTQAPFCLCRSFCPGVVRALDMLSLTTFTTYSAAAGNYQSSATELLCPVETTNVASGTSIAACSDISQGYALPLGTYSSVSNITLCNIAPATYCPGIRRVLTLTSPTAMVRSRLALCGLRPYADQRAFRSASAAAVYSVDWYVFSQRGRHDVPSWHWQRRQRQQREHVRRPARRLRDDRGVCPAANTAAACEC